MKSSTRYRILFFGSLIVVGLLGFFLLTSDIVGNEYDFIFQKMIWFPINMTFIVLIFNRIIGQIDEAREERKFRTLTKRASTELIDDLKTNTVYIVFESTDDEFENHSTEEVFEEIINNLDDYVTDELMKVERTYYLVDGGKEQFDIGNILNIFCTRIDKDLNDFLDKYHNYMDDELYEEATDLKEANYFLGRVYYNEYKVITDRELYKEESHDSDKTEIKELFQDIDAFIDTLRENYEKNISN